MKNAPTVNNSDNVCDSTVIATTPQAVDPGKGKVSTRQKKHN